MATRPRCFSRKAVKSGSKRLGYPGRRIRLGIGLIAVAACAAGVAVGASAGSDVLDGATAGGAHYRYTAALKGASVCERLTVKTTRGRSNLSNCQPLGRAKVLSGYWNADCRSGDVFAFGSITSGASTVGWAGRAGRRAARIEKVDGHRTFLVVLSPRDLPGVLKARRASQTVDRFRLGSRHALCSGVGSGGHAFYIF